MSVLGVDENQRIGMKNLAGIVDVMAQRPFLDDKDFVEIVGMGCGLPGTFRQYGAA